MEAGSVFIDGGMGAIVFLTNWKYRFVICRDS